MPEIPRWEDVTQSGMNMDHQLSRSNLTMGRAPVVEVVIPCGARDGGQGMTKREVGGDGVAVITICNPPVNSLSIDGGGTGMHGGGRGRGRRSCCGGAGLVGDGRPRRGHEPPAPLLLLCFRCSRTLGVVLALPRRRPPGERAAAGRRSGRAGRPVPRRGPREAPRAPLRCWHTLLFRREVQDKELNKHSILAHLT